MEKKNKELLAALAQCADACNRCATACLEEKDVNMMAACIKLDMDCAHICSVTQAFVARNSPHAAHVLKECAEICAKCAAECEKHDMDHCKACAETCRQCEQACKQGMMA